MNIVQSGQPFSFNYTAYDQASDLNIAFSIYNVSSGTAVFITKIVSAYADFGAYMASYTASTSMTYLVIGVVYTDNTYTIVDTSRSPTAEVFQTISGAVTTVGFAYAAYDQSAVLDVQASIFNMTLGTPLLVDTVELDYVGLGVYFGSFVGGVGSTYEIASVVYTDNTFVTPDLTYAPLCDEFESISASINVLGSARLVGQRLAAVLVADN